MRRIIRCIPWKYLGSYHLHPLDEMVNIFGSPFVWWEPRFKIYCAFLPAENSKHSRRIRQIFTRKHI